MEGDISGVRILPPVLEFYDTNPDTLYTLNVTVINVAKKSQNIRYYGPKSEFLKLKVKNPEQPVANGLSVKAVVEYQCPEKKEFKDRLVVTVDGDVIEVPIHIYPSQPVLELDGEVDFGSLVANSKVVAREIPLINHGSMSGEFRIAYAGSKPITIIPSSGTVPPKSVQMIKVELVTKKAGSYEEIAGVFLEKQEARQLLVRANIVDRALQVLSVVDQEPISCLKFGNTYYGTDRTECAILYNNGPEPVSYVAVLDEEAIAQELGTDTTQSGMAALQDTDKSNSGETNPLISLITCIPNQGVLKPHEKTPVFFRFSPRWNASQFGWKGQFSNPPPRKDYAIYLRLEIIGASSGFSQHKSGKKSNVEGSYVEVALTGTALPVLLSISPTTKFDFGECPVKEHADVLCTIRNDSNHLPAIFQFRRIAHFTAHPPNGKVNPGQAQDIIFSFAPSQYGSFEPKQLLDVIGEVSHDHNPTLVSLQVIHTLPIQFKGHCNPVSVKPQPKFNMGITPLITNEVGMFVDTTFSQLNPKTLRNAVASATRTKLHRLRTTHSLDDSQVRVAFPNDRYASIRPTERGLSYQSMFTRKDRYNFVDPDYAMTDDELLDKFNHKKHYRVFLDKCKDRRKYLEMAQEYSKTNNPTDIGMKSASGLKPKKLKLEHIKPDPPLPQPPNSAWKLLSTKELRDKELNALDKPISEGLNAQPLTLQEKADCKKRLAPQELHQIVIGPPVIDFGKVCLRSTNQKDLLIINNLNQHIYVVAQVDCRELRHSSPLSQVVPPQSKATIPIIFESNTKGKFQRSVSYTVNSFHEHHVTVLADVTPVDLELSTNTLVLQSTLGLPAEAGFRGVITLYNRLNYPAEFAWQPILGDKGTAFSIRPATGVVEAFADLDCEVVWHPSFLAPETGSFNLHIHGGETHSLQCRAELGNNNVYFVDRRIAFGTVPINLPTIRTVQIRNGGPMHAYFQVLDPNPIPGLIVSPVHGVVPVGGNAELRVVFTPDAILKFDTRIQVAIKGFTKLLELRMGGTVESPAVDIDVAHFHFGGVYCSSGSVVPFKLNNKGTTKAKVDFDLTRYRDFSLVFPGSQTGEDYDFQMKNPGMYSVSLAAGEVVDGELTFMPTEVASYDFKLSVVINSTGAPSPAPTPFPPTPAPSQRNSLQHIINPRPQPPVVATPSRRVVATALRQPLTLSCNKIDFSIPAVFHDMSQNIGISKKEIITLKNNSDRKLKWGLDLCKQSDIFDEGIFKFVHPSGVPFVKMTEEETRGIEAELDKGESQQVAVVFCPKVAGFYSCLVPVVINNNYDNPYQYIQINGVLKSPRITFHPPSVCLLPVPLWTEISEEFTILCTQYRECSTLSVELPDVECEDETTISPLKVTFPMGNEIKPCSGDEGHSDPFAVPCKVTFNSSKPVSFCKPLIFSDGDGQKFAIFVTATADNSLLTCYPYLALHRTDHQIICEQGVSPKEGGVATQGRKRGEAVFVPCLVPGGSSRPSTSATSSNFQISTSSFESSASVSGSESGMQSAPLPTRDGAMNKPPVDSEENSPNPGENQRRSVGSAMFPDEDTDEGYFHMEVLMTAQRWFSSHGWPSGPNPIVIPETLRIVRQHISPSPKALSGQAASEDGSKSGTVKKNANNNKKGKSDNKQVYDMVAHLAGRPVPGIPLNAPLPFDPIERVKQIHWQHSTLLTFIRCQGGCVASIKPEHLMEPRDYLLWCQLQRQLRQELLAQGQHEEAAKIQCDENIDEATFEAISKRAWTDVLLQILKTLVLAKVTAKSLHELASPDPNVELPTINPDPLSSNIYSIGERILLAWLNHNYEHYRHRVWQDCPKGGVPPARWVVNFDFDLLDGLVLGAVLGAHMPFLIHSHLIHMYTHPSSAEQCLHNALKVVNALHFAGFDYDIQAIDITDPNPIALMLLCSQLYQRLPQYLPSADIEFVGSLHDTITRQVKLSNPSGRNLNYQVILSGRDARDFKVPKGELVVIPARETLSMAVEFRSRFLRPCEACLVLVGRRQGASTGTTLAFNLRTQINNILPKHVIHVKCPAYSMERVLLEVSNPFNEAGDFKIVVVEARDELADSKSGGHRMHFFPRKKKNKNEPQLSKHSERHGQPAPIPADIFKKNKGQECSLAMSAFFCPMSNIYLDTSEKGEVEVDFLPFNLGLHQCSIIFLNESIGEFLYSIEAHGTLPKPSILPYKPSQRSFRVSSAAAAGSGRGYYGGDDKVIYLRCDVGQKIREVLHIPISNEAKQQALCIAAQQRMSDVELQRRQVAGTLTTSNVMAGTLKQLSANPDALVKHVKMKGPSQITYNVEVNSTYFQVPDELSMPVPLDRARSAPGREKKFGDEGYAELPISFMARKPGHYQAEIVLWSPDDVRTYNIECTVSQGGNEAEIEFVTAVHQSITQEIPIINMTQEDWPLVARLDGEEFLGPPSLLAKAGQETKYPIIFKPMHETTTTGKLVLVNRTNGTEHLFHLKGKGEKPLPLDHIKIKCEAKGNTLHILKLPNVSKRKLYYNVECDIPFITGKPGVNILPNQVVSYEMVVSPRKRGVFRGVITFTAGPNPEKAYDSDGEEIVEEFNNADFDGYRVWYALEVNVLPSKPERTMTISCPCFRKMVMEVIVRNPTTEDIHLEATIKGRDLKGDPGITLGVGEKDVYMLTFTPTAIGQTKGALIFFNEVVGEFWYELILLAEPPPPTTLPHVECELGRWVRQEIMLENPTDGILELMPTLSNTNNFRLERDNEKPIKLLAHSSLRVPMSFMPSSLGHGDHFSKIIFNSPQLGEWIFVASGTGLLPQPQDPVCVYGTTGHTSSLTIPFRNPLDVPVVARVSLSEPEDDGGELTDDDTGFRLASKPQSELRIGPKATKDITVSFSPTKMEETSTLCTIAIHREDKKLFDYQPSQADRSRGREAEGIAEIKWIYPIKGVPEMRPAHDSPPGLIECQARECVDQKVEVLLTGAVPSASGPQQPKLTLLGRTTPPTKEEETSRKPRSSDGVVVGKTMAMADEYTCSIEYPSESGARALQGSVKLELARQTRDPLSGLVLLEFNIRFSPYRSMKYPAELVICSASGARWRFSLLFSASEPQVDDIIDIEAIGLGKESGAKFTLFSLNDVPTAFNSFFTEGSDPGFQLDPKAGVLMPEMEGGTTFYVSFTPVHYGKTYTSRLIIHTNDMQWSYQVRCVLPEYRPPRGRSAKPISGPHPDLRTRHAPPVNYLRENLKLLTTAVSSPIKGAPLLPQVQ